MTRRCKKLRLALVAAAAALSAAGCGPRSGALWFFLAQPKESVPAEYHLAPGPLLVLVDDPLGQMELAAMQDSLAEVIGRRLAESNAHRDLVPQQRLQRLRRLEPDFDNLAVRQVGQRVGAEQVLYVLVTRCRLQDVPESGVCRGQLAAQVKVINALAKPGEVVRLWPREIEGRVVEVSLPRRGAHDDAARQQVADTLLAAAAKKIARLFCDHEIDPQNPDL